ncbi:O-antigen ligase family protein [Desulfobacter latus]|uniref:O-antigen ligase family protein n=1 Tax=Desulfobacter latus TaxID=2292 RepID=A0A850SUI8_9BACT|nr:O-antigen ligase family protein [Desulfobacter latus]NWH05034.1 O-antigen ligase family protein [Desulfobacter latus]
MFPIKSLAFISIFLICTAGAIFLPHLGIYGYLADYCIGTSEQWWEAPFSGLGIRYSFTLALATIGGFVLQRHKLRFGFSIITIHEALCLLFLLLMWMSYFGSNETMGRYTTVDHPTEKFTKIVLFVLLMTHIITDRKKLSGLLWVFILCALSLGLKSWELPRRAYVSGRLEGIGGADFAEANFFAAFMAAMLPLIGVQLLRSKNWSLRILCIISAAFTANAVVLCRSRGALVGIVMGGMAAVVMAPKRFRKKIAIGLILGAMGGLYVADQQFLERISTIIVSEDQERDASAENRFHLWAAGLQMVIDRPFGIGVGNWYQTIGSYLPEHAGLDSHNTYVKCIAEMGILGFLIFAFMIFFSLIEIRRINRDADYLPLDIQNDLKLFAFGIFVSIAIILTCGLTITMIYTETVWILLILPVCLRRTLENALLDHKQNIQNGEM